MMQSGRRLRGVLATGTKAANEREGDHLSISPKPVSGKSIEIDSCVLTNTVVVTDYALEKPLPID
jgi:hypothetical protein